jgi:hypothetical protein
MIKDAIANLVPDRGGGGFRQCRSLQKFRANHSPALAKILSAFKMFNL